jgi:hypothetical protein
MNLSIANQYVDLTYPLTHIAVNHHRTHKNNQLSFVNYPYLIDIYKDTSPKMVLKKSTQSGITEYLIVRTIYRSYTLKRNIFYVLPTEKLKNQFVNARFDQSVQYTELYRGMFVDSIYNNMSIKQVGSASIFFAVSNSRSNFTSFPGDDIVVDEMDECNFENLAMAPERVAFCFDPTEVFVGNPTLPDIGIDSEFSLSDQKHWFLTCECGHKFTPDFFLNIVQQIDDNDYMIIDKSFDSFHSTRDINIICEKCGRPVDRHSHGEWVKKNDIPDVSGRQMNQLFTSNKKIKTIVSQFNEGLNNDIKLQRFYNGTLGLAYIGKGARIDDELIDSCVKDYPLPYKCKGPCAIGMDVGNVITTTVFNIIKNEFGAYTLRLVFAGNLQLSVTKEGIDISELEDLFHRFNIIIGGVDAKPEIRVAKMIAATWSNIFRVNYLTDNPNDSFDEKNKEFKTDRTAAMDNIKNDMRLGGILFPRDLDTVQGFRDQLKAPMRIFEEKDGGNGRWVYREGNKADHFYHSMVYAQQAVRLLSMVGR